MSEAPNRRAHVETLRGLAALVVVAHHLVLALNQDAILSSDPTVSWARSPLHFLVSGGGAVAFFFVLSGDVLATPLLRTTDERALWRSIVKRWPRLLGPVVVVVLASWALFVTGAYRFEEASEFTRNGWLQTFAAAIPNDAPPPSLTFADAIAQGTWRTFLFGDYSFNSCLWTMQWEFFGSLGVFALVAVVRWVRDVRAQAAFLVLVTLAVLAVSPQAATFGVGVLLAWWRQQRTVEVSARVATIAVVIACLCLGYEHSFGFYAFIPAMNPAIAQAVGSALLIVASEGCAPLKHALSGRLGGWLGRLSFPLYLVHLPVICSAGAAALVAVAPVAGLLGGEVALVGVSLIVSFVAALALSAFEQHWLRLVRRLGLALVPPVNRAA